MRYIISDTHWNHSLFIDQGLRPFQNIEEMNQKLINNWNSTIHKRAKVYHLGDFCFGNAEMVESIVKQLNGDIHLILGNHDRRRTDSWWNDRGIKHVYRYPIILEKYFILSHEPINENVIGGFINLHGHTHSQIINSTNGHNWQYINCCVENSNYKPQSLDKILDRHKSIFSDLEEI